MATLGLEQIHELEGHTDRVWDVAWCPARNLLASCSSDKTIRIWEGSVGSSSWTCKTVLDYHGRTVRSCQWSPEGKHLASASFDGTVAVWEIDGSDHQCIASLQGHENEVKSVAWSSSGDCLATCGRDKTVWIWECQPDFEFETISVLNGHTQDVKMVLFHPREDLLVSASYDNTIRVWAPDDTGDDWTCIQTLDQGHTSTVWKVAFDPTGDRMVSCSDDRQLIVWDTSSDPVEKKWRHLCTISGYHDRPIYAVDWASQNNFIASACGDDAIRIFAETSQVMNVPSFSLMAVQEKAHNTDVNCVRWHPKEANILASAGDDGLIKLWRLPSSSP